MGHHVRAERTTVLDPGGCYRTLIRIEQPSPSKRYQLDEFPMGTLIELGNNNPQACRMVKRTLNEKQGNDYKIGKSVQWEPCSDYLANVCHKPTPHGMTPWAGSDPEDPALDNNGKF
ncbi:CAZyme family GH18 [Penicillium hispanicum]|uniref:CAZyme family GH18 n=1 Tax=Penicillium hispanicum TaxID=1080232 RepID=UPI002542644F|nr:CAZyme family GH18 [Penicillium hispanicum]KAJ5587185.1 CAZyme family GH18 [Penicillium hispanicum]